MIAPALIPVAPGDRVKTDKRDARRLVRQFRAGELVAIRVPSRQDEAVRDLCRARGDAVEDLTRAKNRLGHFLLRHGRWRGGASTWTFKYRNWLGDQSFDHAALTTTFARYRATVQCREAELEALEADLARYVDEEPFASPVRRLSAYRGVDRLGALVLQAEICDWRRFANDGAIGVLLGRARAARVAHPCRQHAPAVPADRHGRNAKLLLTVVLGPVDRVEGLYLYPDQRRRLRRPSPMAQDHDQ